jgi:hypothetical protein
MTQPIRPPNHQITPEAAEALAAQGIPIPYDLEDIGSDVSAEPGSVFIPEPTFDFDVPPGLPIVDEDGDSIPIVTGVIAEPAEEPKRSRRTKTPEPDGERDAKTGPPDIHEWMDFFSKVLLRFICDWYISWAFSGIDEDLLSDREIERIQLSDDERKRIARPFAELSYKSKFMRKHGRTIVASGGAFDALVALGAWTARVNRISKKYKKPNPRQQRAPQNGSSGPREPEPSNGFDYANGTNGGRVPDGARIVNPYT